MRLLWVTAHLALAALALAYWDIYLFKRFMQSPGVVVLLLAAIFAVVFTLRELARRVPTAERGWVARLWASLDGRALLYLGLFLILACIQHYAYMRAASDGRAYFLMVRSLVIDWDVQFQQDVASFGYNGGVMSYALGTPLLWVPFFLAAHVWLGVRNLFGADYSMDGFFNPYQRASGFGTLILGMIALVVIDRLLRRHFSARLATFTTFTVAIGGWLAWYMAVDASWSHSASALSVAMFVSYWDATRKARTGRQWAVFGLLGGFMILVRWQNIFFAVFPLADAIGEYWRIRSHGDWSSFVERLRVHVSALACAFLVFVPQLLVWQFGRGHWLDVPASDHQIFWDSRFFWDTLFHLDRGIFTWTPLMAFAVLGVLALWKQDRRFAGLLLVAFALQVWINGTLWWGDHGFGARRFSNCVVIFAVGLAALLDWSRRRPLVAPAFLVVVMVVLNGFFMREVHVTSLQQEGGVSLERMVSSVTKRIGHPMALPRNAWFAWQLGGDFGLYGRMGSQTFNNARIDIGTPGDDRFLGGGWSAREGNAEYNFRWTVGRSAFIALPTKAQAPYLVEFVAETFVFPDAPGQSVQLLFNGRLVAETEIVPPTRQYQIEVPREFVRSGFNAVELRFATAVSPASQGMSNDSRKLAVRFDRIEFLRKD